MPAFSSSINKSGTNKRVIPKAPPRRTIRNATITKAVSQSHGATPENEATPETQDSQPTGAVVTSNQRLEPNPDVGGKASVATKRRENVTVIAVSESHPVQSCEKTVQTAAALTEPNLLEIVSTATAPSQSLLWGDTTVPAEKSVNGLQEGRAGTGVGKAKRRIGRPTISNNGTASTTQTTPRALRSRNKAPKEAPSTTKDVPHATGLGTGGQSLIMKPKVGAELSDQPAPGNKKRSRPRRSSMHSADMLTRQQLDEEAQSPPTTPTANRVKPARRKKQKKSAQELAAEVIAEAARDVSGGQHQGGGRKRKRRVLPEDAENHEIMPSQVTMGDLVTDFGLGKGSRREAEMEKIDWAEVKRKRRKAAEEARHEQHQQSKNHGDSLPAAGPHAAERLILVNGQIVIDESSRVIDRSAATIRDADQVEDAISEDRLTARVNQSTVGRQPGYARTYASWDDEMTEQFYQGLRLFGTDFMMISKMFPGTSRAVVKKKFNKEERLYPEKVLVALNTKEPVDLPAFSELTNTVYEDPKDFYNELEEETARLEAEDTRIRAEDAEADQDTQMSTEQEEAGESDGEEAAELLPARRNRFTAEARRIVDAAVARKKKGKKTPSTKKVKKKKDGRKGKGLPAEGTAEMIGSIEDFVP